MPTIQFEDNFDHAITSPTFYSAIFGSPTSVRDPLYAWEPASVKIPSAGSNVGVRKDYTGSPSLPWTGFAYYSAVHPAGVGAVNIAALHPTGAGNDEMRIEISGDGAGGSLFKSYFTGGSVVNGPAYTAGTWVWIEAIADFLFGTYNGYWQVAGVTQTQPTKVGEAAAGSDYVQLISYTGGATLDFYCAAWKGGMASSSTDFLKEPPLPFFRYRRLAGPVQLGTSATTVYRCPLKSRATIRRIFVNNPSGSQAGLTLSIGSDAAATRLWDGDNVPAGGEIDHNGDHALAAGDTIQAYSDTASTLVLVIDGYTRSEQQ